MNLRAIIEAGHVTQAAAKAEKEKEKAGLLRIGSAGAVCSDGQLRGVCPRIALLRRKGIEKQAGLHTRIMWNHGETSEINAQQVIAASGIASVLEPLKVVLNVGSAEVHGSPDLAIDFEGKTFGVELKCVFSANTAILVSLDRKPKNENLIQALAYQQATGLPWVLMYSNPNYFKGYHNKKYVSIEPFYSIFYLKWEDGVAYYRHEFEDEWVKTLITEQSVADFYNLVDEMDRTKDLPPPPTGHYVDGTAAKYPDPCGLCDFRAACADWDMNQDYDRWLEKCKESAST